MRYIVEKKHDGAKQWRRSANVPDVFPSIKSAIAEMKKKAAYFCEYRVVVYKAGVVKRHFPVRTFRGRL